MSGSPPSNRGAFASSADIRDQVVIIKPGPVFSGPKHQRRFGETDAQP